MLPVLCAVLVCLGACTSTGAARSSPVPSQGMSAQSAEPETSHPPVAISRATRSRRFANLWDHLMAAHAAFAEDRHQEARELYALARERGSSAAWLEDMIGYTYDHEQLRAQAAPTEYALGVVFVTERRETAPGGEIRRIEDVTDAQKAKWRAYLGVVARLVEAFSRGGIRVSLEYVDAVATYPRQHDLHPANPDYLDCSEHFFERTPTVDGFLVLSNAVSPARGLARRYPIIAGAVYGPTRGMTAVNPGTHGWLVALHELFHSFEFMARISPTHGFESGERASFPGWQGATEYDYYRYHLQTTIAAKGFDVLSFRRRYPAANSEERRAAYRRIRDAYRTIPLARRRRAQGLAKQARSAEGERRLLLLERALELSPYLPEALTPLRDHYDSVAPERAAELAKRLADVRLAADGDGTL